MSGNVKNVPVVTVLMPVYNGAAFLPESIKSILLQTFNEFELLIIDDGSTDNSVAIIQSFDDSRIRLILNGMNIGVSESLNKGLELARGTYVARMDHDDICVPERLTRQVAFMEAHKNIGICGTWIETFGETTGETLRYPTDPDTIKCIHIFGPALAHPSVMIRKETLEQHNLLYDPAFKRAQDFDLWVRSSQYTSLANIGEVLLFYRLHNQQVGQRHNDEQLAFAGEVLLAQLHKIGINVTTEEFDLHQSICMWRFKADRSFIDKVEKWFCKLIDANLRVQAYPERIFSEVLCRRWFEVCNALTELGPWILKKYLLSSLSHKINVPWRRRVGCFTNCMFGRRSNKGDNVTII